MRFVIYTNALSEHQIPLAREIASIIGHVNFRYVYTSKNGQKLQESKASDEWIQYLPQNETDEWLENADVMLVGGIRPIDLMERRLAKRKTTLYMSERWFKPVHVFGQLYVPGWVRLIYPSYWRMAKRFSRLFEHPDYRFLPIGPWALHDMDLLGRIMGIIVPDTQVIKWGDFVEPSKYQSPAPPIPTHVNSPTLKILWVGRLLNWKRVDTIIRAVGELSTRLTCSTRFTLDIYGTGPEEKKLRKLAARYGNIIKFYPPVPITEVRKLMREHDIYVLASNACEGWGAVVNEALEENMKVLGTYEAGASAALLPRENLFPSGDRKALEEKLLAQNKLKHIQNPVNFTPKGAAMRLFAKLK